MIDKKKKLVLCHLYYEDLAFGLLEKLHILNDDATFFAFNLSSTLYKKARLLNNIRDNFPQSAVIYAPNAGRDIGAKLRLFQVAEALNISHDYTLILHDKKSPHTKEGAKWSDELLRIIDTKTLPNVYSTFESLPDVGIICSKNYIQNEHVRETNSFLCTSNSIIKSILATNKIQTKDYSFVAGNIFWVRSELLKQFFQTKMSTDKIIASLEKGNNIVDFSKGTYVHAWERIMCWIATSQGYKIYGV